MLNRMAVDPQTGSIYVGAVNALFKLSPQLELLDSVVTGPKMDSVNCSPGHACIEPMALTGNVNKVLVIDDPKRRLIACGSVGQVNFKRNRLL